MIGSTVPKMLVGCPTWMGKGYILKECAAALTARQGSFDVLLVDASPDDSCLGQISALGLPCERISWIPSVVDRVVAGRNLLRKRFLGGGYDYFLSLEQDVLVQSDTFLSLLSHEKDFVTTLVMNRTIVDGEAHIVPLVSVDYVDDLVFFVTLYLVIFNKGGLSR